MLPFSTLMKLEKKFFFHSLLLVKNAGQILITSNKDFSLRGQILITSNKDLSYSDGKKWLNLINFFHHNSMIFWKMLRIFWFIQKIENLKINFFPYKMGQNTCKNFQKWNFSKNAPNLMIHPKNWKFQNQFLPIQNGSKHLKFFSKIKLFKKMLKIVWFVQKIENLKINLFHTKWDKKLSKIEFLKTHGTIIVIRVIGK